MPRLYANPSHAHHGGNAFSPIQTKPKGVVYLYPMPKTTTMFEKPLCFVDIETTGGRAQASRIIEIGIVRVENSGVVREWQQLINPQTWLPSEITHFSGITPDMLTHQPTFAEVADHLLQLLEGSIFVAHNARFDYSFIKAEFERLHVPFHTLHVCSVKLSRRFYPQYASHSLDSVIARHGFACAQRHRALADARVIWQLVQHLTQAFGLEVVARTIQELTRSNSFPEHVSKQDIEALPHCPGVYIFYDEHGAPLYVGKSINIKQRVLSHFYADLHSSRELRLKQETHQIEAITTAGEFDALLTESQMIKKLLPIFNRRLRKNQRLHWLALSPTDTGVLTLKTHTNWNPQAPNTHWLAFRTKKQADTTITQVIKEHGLCRKLLKLESGSGPCFAYHLEQCKGVCAGLEPVAFHNARAVQAFSHLKVASWPFEAAIAIREYNPATDQAAVHVIDRWLYVGKLSDSGEILSTTEIDPTLFDLDAYHIIKRFIVKHPHSYTRLDIPPSSPVPSREECSFIRGAKV